MPSQNLAFRGPRGPGASKAQPPRSLVGHCTSGRPLNPPLQTTAKSEVVPRDIVIRDLATMQTLHQAIRS